MLNTTVQNIPLYLHFMTYNYKKLMEIIGKKQGGKIGISLNFDI